MMAKRSATKNTRGQPQCRPRGEQPRIQEDDHDHDHDHDDG